jgi:hypothetical protein
MKKLVGCACRQFTTAPEWAPPPGAATPALAEEQAFPGGSNRTNIAVPEDGRTPAELCHLSLELFWNFESLSFELSPGFSEYRNPPNP